MSDSDPAPPAQAPVKQRAPGWLRGLRYGALAAVLLLAGFVAGVFAERARSGPAPLADLGPAPQYTLTNQLGRKVSSKRFAGKVRVVTFLFPYCTTYCPLIAAHLMGFERLMVLAQSGLQDKVEIVSFNIAPDAAGPKQMREFLHQYGWDPKDPHWQYLTGSKAQIRRVVTGGYHVAYRRVADGADAGTAQRRRRSSRCPIRSPPRPSPASISRTTTPSRSSTPRAASARSTTTPTWCPTSSSGTTSRAC